MGTLQVAAGALVKELETFRDETVIKAVKWLKWAARRENTNTARADVRNASGCLRSPTTSSQQQALKRINALLQPAPTRRGSTREIDTKDEDWNWCKICGDTAVRYFKPHRSQYLVAVCDRHAQPHLRAQDLSMIQCAMAAPENMQDLLYTIRRESAVNLELDAELEAKGINLGDYDLGKWTIVLLEWWKVAAAKSVIEAWQRLTNIYPNSSIDSQYSPALEESLCYTLYGAIRSHFGEIDAGASQQNGRKGGRPPVATEAQIRRIRQLAAKGTRQVDIAAQVGLSQAHISRLLKS